MPFGIIHENTKTKDIIKSSDLVDYVIEDKYNGDTTAPYYLFLLNNNPNIVQKKSLITEIEKYSHNYTILNAVNSFYDRNKLKGEGVTEFMKTHRSDWRKYINMPGRKHCEAIMAFGIAMYSINGSSDILTDDFVEDKMLHPYYYMGHEIYKYDTYIYPVYNIDEIYPNLNNFTSTTNYKTRFFWSQIQKMTNPSTRTWTPDTRDVIYHVVNSKEEANKVFAENKNAKLVAFDTETNGFFFYENKIHCLTICWNGVDGYYIPWKYVDVKVFEDNVMSCERRTGANPKFDLKFFWKSGVSTKVNVTDATDRIIHCIASNLKVGLKPMSYRWTCFGGYDLTLDTYKKKTKCEDYSKIPQDILSKYATMDAIVTWRSQVELWNHLDWLDTHYPNDKLPNWTLRRWYETQMMPIYKEICNVEYRGIYVNEELRKKHIQILQTQLNKDIDELRKLWNVTDPNFNFFSNDELGKLFMKLGWKDHGFSDKGYFKTDGDAITLWKREGMPGMDLISEARTLNICINSFLGIVDEKGRKTGWLQYINHDITEGNPEDDYVYKIQQSYDVMGTETFRFIGKNPNFQNIPTRSKWASYVKRTITCPPADLYIIIGDSGKEYHLAEFELVKTTNRGWVQAIDLTENDNLAETENESDFIKRCSIDVNGHKVSFPDENIWYKKCDLTKLI